MAPKHDPFEEGVSNDAQIELNWAMKAAKYAETYDRLRKSVKDLTTFRMTKIDDLIYSSFRFTFPELNIDAVEEEELKSEDAKKKWRPFLMPFEGKIPDWNMATLLRVDCKKDCDEHNTIIVPRCQYLAIEIARNKEGVNAKQYAK
ncbi:putative polysaccharide biosynthesis protein [Carpediemonas membranifera]|uniref:Putative polysaccharide biosynthesis protein n=1 Tax=Carpediemonas membranifera TaxID=201153 RepID=A0A8J6B7I2_9EUKA|nr:putative polysaccharide biosynthesis protein [Carpediemonas membranifera]|eukprot:KAG9397248.1 putative polysaccharide biosynthesis protein [Carpediemonas membranifera]